jgi:DNA-directed RNA polymerase subunit M/transcription elongation factor TFIIS
MNEPEKDLDKCPDCKSERLKEYFAQNGPDDYSTIRECLDCGATESS